jgi:hypothetical protein
VSVSSEIRGLLTTIPNVTGGDLPDTPDNSVAVYRAGGYARSASGTFVGEATVQVKVRNTSYAAGEALCDTIADLLHCKSTTKLLGVYQQGDILDLGRDAKGRPEWTLNFRCYYRK